MLNNSRSILKGIKGNKGFKMERNSFGKSLKETSFSSSSSRGFSQKIFQKQTNQFAQTLKVSSTLLFKKENHSFVSSRNVGYEKGYSHETEEVLEEELPTDRLPYGVFGSLIVPFVFCAGVAGAALALVNNDAAREKRRKRILEEEKAKAKGGDQGVIQNIKNQFNDVQRMVIGVVAVNTAVFAAWRIPALTPYLRQYFTSSTLNPNPVTHLLSAFSHQSALHFAFNMIAFNSIALGLQNTLTREQILAIYFAGATTSSFASHAVKLAFRDYSASHGASGSVYALLATTAYFHPSASFALIFLPAITFTAQSIIPVLVAAESLGLGFQAFRIWSSGMDHAAHLGGLLFGWLYSDWLLKSYKKRIQKNKK